VGDVVRCGRSKHAAELKRGCCCIVIPDRPVLLFAILPRASYKLLHTANQHSQEESRLQFIEQFN